MQPSIFATLCDICNELDAYVLSLESGPVADRLGDLVERFDSAIDRTIGLEPVDVPADE